MFFPVDGLPACPYGRRTQTIPVGETAFAFREEEAAPKEQPAPETLRQTDRRRMGLWKVVSACPGLHPPTK
jgi:hypothetical protein